MLLQNKEYTTTTFRSEDLYNKLNEFLALIGFAERENIIAFAKFRIEKLRKGEEVYYIIIDEIHERLTVVRDDDETLCGKWVYAKDKVKKIIETELGLELSDPNVIVLSDYKTFLERKWKEKRMTNLKAFMRSFAVKETRTIKGMLVNILENEGIIGVDVAIDHIILEFYELLKVDYKSSW